MCGLFLNDKLKVLSDYSVLEFIRSPNENIFVSTILYFITFRPFHYSMNI